MANGLASPLKKETDILATTRKAFGKLNRNPPTLGARLESLSEQELNLVLNTAQFVKLAHSFGSRVGNTQAYFDLAKEMYPKMGYTKQKLIADILQDAEPVEVKPTDKSIERDTAINKTLDDYAAALGKATNDINVSKSYAQYGTPVDDAPINMKGRVVEPEEVTQAEALQTKILERLGLNEEVPKSQT